MKDNTRHYKTAFVFEAYCEERFLDEYYGIDNVDVHVGDAGWASFKSKHSLKIKHPWQRTPDAVALDHNKKLLRVAEFKERKKGGSVDEKFTGAAYWLDYYKTLADSIGYTASYEYWLCMGHKDVEKIIRVLDDLKATYYFVGANI